MLSKSKTAPPLNQALPTLTMLKTEGKKQSLKVMKLVRMDLATWNLIQKHRTKHILENERLQPEKGPKRKKKNIYTNHQFSGVPLLVLGAGF